MGPIRLGCTEVQEMCVGTSIWKIWNSRVPTGILRVPTNKQAFVCNNFRRNSFSWEFLTAMSNDNVNDPIISFMQMDGEEKKKSNPISLAKIVLIKYQKSYN